MKKNPTGKDAYMVIPAEYVTTADGTGLVHTAPGHGIEDFVSITYTCPNGTAYSCNDHAVIGRVSPTLITITPPMEPYTFPPDMVEVYSEIEIVFVGGAYGDYELIAWTDHPPGE